MRDSKPFLKMLREDGDFQGYCGVKFSEKNLSKFATYFERTGRKNVSIPFSKKILWRNLLVMQAFLVS